MWPRFIARLLPPKQVKIPIENTAQDRTEAGRSRDDFDTLAPDPFVLLLRTFGEDGDIRVGNPKDGVGFETNTIESTIAVAVSQRGMTVRALHDEKADFIPAHVDYFTTENDGWFERFLQLANRSMLIIVLSVGDLGLGKSFRGELGWLKTNGLTGKVVVLFPPTLGSQRNAKKNEVFEELGWAPPAAIPLVAYKPHPESPIYCHPSLGNADDSLADRYALGLESAARLILE